MARITVTDLDEVYRDGALVESTPVERDVTAEVVEFSLHDKARKWLPVNRAYLATTPSATAAARISALEAQVALLTRQCTALTRLLIRADLLDDAAGT